MTVEQARKVVEQFNSAALAAQVERIGIAASQLDPAQLAAQAEQARKVIEQFNSAALAAQVERIGIAASQLLAQIPRLTPELFEAAWNERVATAIGHLERAERPPEDKAADAGQFHGRPTDGANAPADARDHVGTRTPTMAGSMSAWWNVLQLLLMIDNLLGDPGATTLRETVSGVANELLLLLLLVTVAQAPSPPPAPAIPVLEAYTTPTQITEGSSMDSDGLPECRPLTADTGLDTTDRDEESDRKGVPR